MASTIAQLIMEQGRQSAESRTELAKIAANALTSNASAAAEAARQKGAIWGGAINQIGQSIAAIPGNIQHQKSLDLQQQDIQAQIAERQSLAQERQAKVAQEQRAESDAKLFDAALTSATDPETGLIDVKALSGKVPSQLLEKNIPIIDTHNKALTAFNDAKDAALSSQFLRAYISGDPNTLASAGQSGAGIGLMKPEDAANLQQIADAIKAGPQVAQKPSTQAISVHVGGRLKAFQPMLQHYLDEQGKQAHEAAQTRELDAQTAERANPKPVVVAPGGTLVNPTTGAAVFTAPEKTPAPAPFSLAPGGVRFDPTGKPIASLPPTPEKAPDQNKLEQEYRTVLARGLSSRSGGLGMEDAKVQQANHLTALIDQSYDPKTDTYNIPKVQQTELALGLARLLSPTGTIGVQLEQEINQRTAKGDVGAALTYITGTPFNGSTQDVVKMFRDSIQRQGSVAEQNREGEMGYLRGLAPTNLDEGRRQKLEATSLNALRQSRVIRNTQTGEKKLQVSVDGGKTWK